jgi:CheY-like chemotaxis protein
VVDDQPDVLDTVALLLRADGHAVRTYLDPRVAVARIVAEPPDLVFTDLGMPGMSGWDVARGVHARHPDLPVVLLTGSGREVGPGQMRAGGIAAVVAKPVDGPALRRALGAALGAARPLRILLVDDSAAFASALATLIGQDGHEVRRTDSGAAGLEALGAAVFDLVLVDRSLPDLPAVEVVRVARRAPGRPMVCVVSGSTLATMEAEVPGADLYVEKVRLPDRLAEVVRTARDRPSHAAEPAA